MSTIKGTTVLITGGASGIGYLTGQYLLEAGAKRLVIWDVREDALHAVASDLAARGYGVDTFTVDLADRAQIQRAAAELRARSIAVDVVINNAGIIVGKEFTEHSPDEIERTMRINAEAPMQVTSALLPDMLERGRGHIVNIASAAGMVSNPRMAVYCASKWAVIGWSDSLRLELERARSGVRVTTIVPYYITTGMFAGVRSPMIPLLDPEYVARRIVAAIRQDRIFLRMPRLVNFLPLVRGILSTRWFDTIVGDWMGVYRSMSTFRGRE